MAGDTTQDKEIGPDVDLSVLERGGACYVSAPLSDRLLWPFRTVPSNQTNVWS
jgi:hypothetical protein